MLLSTRHQMSFPLCCWPCQLYKMPLGPMWLKWATKCHHCNRQKHYRTTYYTTVYLFMSPFLWAPITYICVYICFFSQHLSVTSQLKANLWIAQMRLTNRNTTPLTLPEGRRARWGPSKTFPSLSSVFYNQLCLKGLPHWQHHFRDNKRGNIALSVRDSHRWWQNTHFGHYHRHTGAEKLKDFSKHVQCSPEPKR